MPRSEKSQRERKIVNEFEDWLLQTFRVVTPRRNLKRVGTVLAGEAVSRASNALPPRSSFAVGKFRRGNWMRGEIDVAWNDDGSEWIAEVKDRFTISNAAHALGQVLLYGELTIQDDPSLVEVRKAVVFGCKPGGVVEDGPASHGEEIVRGYAKIFAKYEVAIFLRNEDATFREVLPAP
jgi:hypothetical protein